MWSIITHLAYISPLTIPLVLTMRHCLVSCSLNLVESTILLRGESSSFQDLLVDWAYSGVSRVPLHIAFGKVFSLVQAYLGNVPCVSAFCRLLLIADSNDVTNSLAVEACEKCSTPWHARCAIYLLLLSHIKIEACTHIFMRLRTCKRWTPQLFIQLLWE